MVIYSFYVLYFSSSYSVLLMYQILCLYDFSIKSYWGWLNPINWTVFDIIWCDINIVDESAGAIGYSCRWRNRGKTLCDEVISTKRFISILYWVKVTEQGSPFFALLILSNMDTAYNHITLFPLKYLNKSWLPLFWLPSCRQRTVPHAAEASVSSETSDILPVLDWEAQTSVYKSL